MKALQQTEPSSLSSWLVVAQSALALHVLAQSVQAVPGLVQSALVTAQKLHGVLDVHRDVFNDAQIFQNVYDLISQISTCVSWMKRFSV